jgi:hypothetical protein
MASTFARFESFGEHPKTTVYAAPIDNEESLYHRTVDACHDYSRIPWQLSTDEAATPRPAEARTESHGEHLEHLLRV